MLTRMLITLTILLSSFYSSVKSCSTFCLQTEKQLVFGRNYDWNIDYGLVIVNKRNVEKVTVLNENGTPAKWISKFGSITFNQYGKEFPMDGMNEMGLVVAAMWLSATTYPEPDNRPAIDELPWIQYQLDNFETVDEVIVSNSKIRISNKTTAPVHYLVCDRFGNSATIEFLDGEMVYHTGENLPIPALTNSTYSSSIHAWEMHNQSVSKKNQQLRRYSSIARFIRAADMIKKHDPNQKPIVAYAFDILSNVAQGDHTKWSIVYDIKNSSIHFKTNQYPEIKTVNLKEFDFSCKSVSKAIDINNKLKGNITKSFEDYTTELNRTILYLSTKNTSFTKDTPDSVIDETAKYPETLKCAE